MNAPKYSPPPWVKSDHDFWLIGWAREHGLVPKSVRRRQDDFLRRLTDPRPAPMASEET